MLIYDHTKTFIGLDEEDLRLLGFTTGKELVSACNDVAEFFVKKPGYVHDFKNFEWIDFVLHAESENSKVIINTGKKSFTCDISIKPFFLTQSPENAAYAVTLEHVHPLSASEQADLPAVATPNVLEPEPMAPPTLPIVEAPSLAIEEETPLVSPPSNELPRFDDIETTTLQEPEPFHIPDDTPMEDPYDKPEEIYPDFNKPLEIEDDLFLTPETDSALAPSAKELDIPSTLDPIAPEIPLTAPSVTLETEQDPTPQERPMLGDYLTQDEQAFAESLEEFKNYVYDPHIAADELGLPVDLIEEFIGDFISQAHDFKDEMFDASAKHDFDNLKLLSHKLKGVAANLRIEDAFTMLSTINTSQDQIEIEANLKLFYNTIAKLEGKEASLEPFPEAIPTPQVIEPEPTTAPITDDAPLAVPEPESTPADDDLYDFSIKDTDIQPNTPETPVAPTIDDGEDLYDFTIKDTSAPEVPSSKPADEETSDLYDFDLPDIPVAPLDTDTLATESPRLEPEVETIEPSPALLTPEPVIDPLPQTFESEHEPLQPEGLEPMEPTPVIPNTPPAPSPEFPPYDSNKAAIELGLPLDIVTDLTQDFITYAMDAKEAIVNAVASGDSQVWQQAATRFKGVTDNLRMNDITPLLQELETTSDPMKAENLAARFYDYIAAL